MPKIITDLKAVYLGRERQACDVCKSETEQTLNAVYAPTRVWINLLIPLPKAYDRMFLAYTCNRCGFSEAVNRPDEIEELKGRYGYSRWRGGFPGSKASVGPYGLTFRTQYCDPCYLEGNELRVANGILVPKSGHGELRVTLCGRHVLEFRKMNGRELADRISSWEEKYLQLANLSN